MHIIPTVPRSQSMFLWENKQFCITLIIPAGTCNQTSEKAFKLTKTENRVVLYFIPVAFVNDFSGVQCSNMELVKVLTGAMSSTSSKRSNVFNFFVAKIGNAAVDGSQSRKKRTKIARLKFTLNRFIMSTSRIT